MVAKIIVTIGPGSNKPEILKKLAGRGVDFFRINLSHTNEKEIEKRIKEINRYGIPVILDTEGSQIRSGNETEIDLKEGSFVKVYSRKIKCNSEKIWLNPVESLASFSPGDLIFIDFNSVILKVSDADSLKKGFILCRVLIGGKIGGRKAVFVDSPTFHMPPFSKKDTSAVILAKKNGIKHFTLSFMSCKNDVLNFKKMYPEATIFSKIESRKGLQNFVEIAMVSDGILIDRGDLSHQVPVERIPFIQKYVINKCIQMKKEVFIATNTLEQMASALKPSKAEVNDIINTLLDGATGIALTRETAVGKYPVETVNMLLTLIGQVEFIGVKKGNKEMTNLIDKTNYINSARVPRLLISPHGSSLVNRFNPNLDVSQLSKKVLINEETLMDAEQIATGAFSPLSGFMNKKDFDSVVENMRLANGIVWPLPILLRVSKEQIKHFKPGDKVGLIFEKDNLIHAVLDLEEIYSVNANAHVEKIFGTLDLNHPGVKSFIEQGEFALGGKVALVKKRKSSNNLYELTPLQTRRIFSERGWSKVVGFHTRNVPHRSHEFIQLEALKSSLADGLFVHPVIGKKKSGDFSSEAIVDSYEKMIDSFYPKDKVILCTWASYSRYAGPREALFTALVRKNFGCSHFIVGRDHTGVGNYYSPTASHEIFNMFKPEEIEIIPVKFDKVFYSQIKNEYLHELASPAHPKNGKMHISGTEARERLKKGKALPEWFMRKEISRLLIDKLNKGKKVFVE